MSWQKYSVKLVLGFPLSLPMVAYAINIGDTYVQTQQNQPLNASINVSDINPKTFSVKVAQADVYRQLGLSKESDIQVTFVPTSSNGGQILLRTTRPINAPFTDVVLNITENGITKTLPKTLLMPIDSSQKITTQANTSTFQSPQQTVVIGSPNAVQLPVMTSNALLPQNTPLQTTIVNQMPALPISSLTGGMAIGTAPITLTSENSEHIHIQETRTVTTTQKNNASDTQAVSPQLAPSSSLAQDPLPPSSKTANHRLTTTAAKNNAKKTQLLGDTTTYILQRNDNLWTIASTIAAANHKDVDKVMADIMAANPNAFPDNDPAKLLANTELQIPKYKVVPSQIGIKSANKARQQYRQIKKRAQTKKSVTTAKSVTPPAATNKKTKTSNSVHRYTAPKAVTSITPPKMIKKSEMTIIAPNHTNGSIQGQNNANHTLGKGMSPQVVAQVQQKRQATAQQASKVNKLNQDLVGAENRLKIQNAKLAQLEKRLKELNNK